MRSRRSIRSRTSTARTAPSRSTCRWCPGRASTCAASSSRATRRTADEVLRREMRQFEGAGIRRPRSTVPRCACSGWATSNRTASTSRPRRFAGSNDQVDVVFNVNETTSGSFVFGLGYSQLSGLTTSIQLSQNNFLGSGNRISVEAQRNVYLQRYSFSFLNPYFTDDGLSLGYNLVWREFDNSELQHRAILVDNRCGAGGARPADHRERHRFGRRSASTATRSSPSAAPRRSRSSTTSMRSASAPSTPGAANWAGRATPATTTCSRRAVRYQRVSAEIDAARLDRRVLQAQLRVLEVLAAQSRASCSTPGSSSAMATVTATTQCGYFARSIHRSRRRRRANRPPRPRSRHVRTAPISRMS